MVVSRFRLAACRWNIPTESSRPHTSPRAISDAIIRAVLAVREQLRRCAEVVWHYVTHTLGITVSLSSVRRILRRHHCFDGARKPKVKRTNPKRPLPTAPGELVQIDTIHHVDPHTGKRLYYYTAIDLWSRLSYAETHPVLAPRSSCGSCLEGRPNDNAYVERFNRTLQEECIGHYWHRSVPLPRQRQKLSLH